ncbi:MAG: NAD(P)H-dependent oxidoreductase subunit E [Cyanobacteria bacterium REEB65]|nr:NAD(P)H-dependent oxidoreductase subunit E [Cyanobacteria bacterium REEB65]
MSATTAPSAFAFTPGNAERVSQILSRYPSSQAAILPVLWVAQEQVLADETRPRQLTPDVLVAVARACQVTPAYVLGVATFYTMYHTQPVGDRLLEVCTSVACCLVGGEEIYQHLCRRLDLDPATGGTTPDGRFTVRRAECLAACGYAPMLQLDEGPFLEHLTPQKIDEYLAQWGYKPLEEAAS